MSADALVVGTGPAGLAMAIALAEAGVSVMVVGRSRIAPDGLGESLSPDGAALLSRLGVLDAFRAGGHLPCHANRSAWGGGTIEHHDFIGHPRGKPRDAQFIRPHRIQRRKRAAQNVIAPFEGLPAFHRPEIGDILDHANLAGGAGGVGADRADVGGADIAAHRAIAGVQRHRGHGLRQRCHQLPALFQERQHRAAGRARPKPGQSRHKLDQRFDVVGPFHRLERQLEIGGQAKPLRQLGHFRLRAGLRFGLRGVQRGKDRIFDHFLF